MLATIERVVREEMAAIGAQEVQFPALLPREHYRAQRPLGRVRRPAVPAHGPARARSTCSRPTHEELFTLLVKGECSSYKDFPMILYQMQTKYRDEARPRAGLLRGREFLMKDSYSFDLDDEGLQAAYDAHRAAYQRIFDRLGLDYRIVHAMSGAMGGSASEEFLAPTPVGEDTFVCCTDVRLRGQHRGGDDAVPPAAGDPGAHRRSRLDTPDTPTIETLVAWPNSSAGVGRTWTAADTLKNVVRQGPPARARASRDSGDRHARVTGRSTSSGSSAAAGAGAGRDVRRRTSSRTRSWSAATSGRRRWPS